MTGKLTVQDSVAISHLRVMAMTSIVACHFLQAYSNNWAWVLNIGVQIFMLISGYLYGHKQIESYCKWFYQRFLRVYVPFIVFFVAVLPLYAANHMIMVKQILAYVFDLQGILGGVKGLGHLWFLTAIALCYLITPLLQRLSRYSKYAVWVIIIIIGLVICFLKINTIKVYASLLTIYSIGYVLGQSERTILYIIGVGSMIVFATLLSDFSWEYLAHNTESTYSIAFHLTGSLFFFLFFLFFFDKLNCCKYSEFMGFIKHLDNYSFHIYIVHHILILGPFSLLYVTETSLLNVFIVFFYIAFYSVLLNKISNCLTKRMSAM